VGRDSIAFQPPCLGLKNSHPSEGPEGLYGCVGDEEKSFFAEIHILEPSLFLLKVTVTHDGLVNWNLVLSILCISCLLLIKRYNLYKVLACSTAFFQLSLFCTIFFQLCTLIFLISYKTSFSQRVLGLPIGLLDMGFHLLIF
jgi:hypothetical protein